MVHSLVQKAIALGIIDEESAGIYEYGLEDFLYSFFTWCVFLIAGFIAGMFWYMLLFMAVHIPLRIFAGGIHCATRLRCFLVSVIITVTVFVIPCCFNITLLVATMLFATVPGVITVKLLAPVEDLRKPLNGKEKSRYGNISFYISFAASGIVILLTLFGLYTAAYFAGAAICVVAIQLILGLIKNKLSKKTL